jgi:hypothetical protein
MLPRIEAILAGEDVRDGNVGRTVFHEIRDGKMSAAEKEPMRLTRESNVMLSAGTETTARTLAVTTYYLMKHRDMGDKLRQELTTMQPRPESLVRLAELETLPYLGAVINEGLKLAHGVRHRQPRIATEEDLVYKHGLSRVGRRACSPHTCCKWIQPCIPSRLHSLCNGGWRTPN